jgi:hypothetical protein
MSKRIAQIRSNQAIVYHKCTNSTTRPLSDGQKNGLEKGKSGEYNGYMSKETKRKISGIIDTFAQGVLSLRKKLIEKWNRSPINLTFVTLTLPAKQFHTDEELKRHGLGHFITIMQRKYKHFEYVWRAEPQKNGNIHFHLITNYYIPHQSLRNVWNSIMKKLGYIQKFAERMNKVSFESYFKTYKNKKGLSREEIFRKFTNEKNNGWKNPNSTDIHAIQKVDDITAYVTKYMCKEEMQDGKRIITGRIWGMSDSLRNLEKLELIIWQKDCENVKEIYEARERFDKILHELEVSDIYAEKWFEIYHFADCTMNIMKKMKSTEIDFIEKFHVEQTEKRYFGQFSAYHSLLTATNIPLPEKLFVT